MSPLPRPIAALLVGALLAGPCAGAFAASQLYKCVDGGRTVYQQQACSPSSQPEVAAAPRMRRQRQAHRSLIRSERAAQDQGVVFACFIRARHAPMKTSRPGIRIAPQMILSRFSFTHGMLPNR